MLSRFSHYKSMIEKVNINFNIDEILFDNLKFAGHYFGLYIDNELVVTIPYFPEKKEQLDEYKHNIRNALAHHGDVKKVALYTNSRNGCFYALAQHKSYFGLLSKVFNLRNRTITNIPYIEKETSMILVKEDLSDLRSIGVLKKHKSKEYSFSPFVIFNYEKFNKKIESDLIAAATYLGCGNFVEGQSITSTQYRPRKFKPDSISNELYFLRNVKSFDFNHDVASRFKTKSQKIFFCNRLVNKTLLIGDPLDIDWFGREFGFWALNENHQTVRFYCLSHTDKGFHCPINEL